MTVLHLGCGLDYRPGAINVDRYDLTAADLQADVLRLPLADSSVARIETRQLVEHLGFAGTIYALAEWWRVLVPGGVLVVETPARRATCLAAAGSDPPAAALHWLFGLPWPGYGHRTLFDETDLHALAVQAGFVQVEITRGDARQPTLCLTACKRPARVSNGSGRPGGDLLADLRACLHVGFVAAGIVDPASAPPYMAHLETSCDQILAAVETLPQDGAAACLATVLGATARHDPRVAQVAFQVLASRGRVLGDAGIASVAESYLDLVRSLVDEAFPARLAACLRQIPALPGTQVARLEQLHRLVSSYLTARLYPNEARLHSVLEWFDSAAATLTASDRQITFFCAETVSDLSRRETARGVSAFAKNGHEIAGCHFKTAIAYDADNPLAVWNLARLALIERRCLDALDHYAALLELWPGAAGTLRTEMDAATRRAVEDLAPVWGPVSWEEVG